MKSLNCSLPGSSVHGILQAGILEWVTMPSSRGSSQPKDRAQVSCLLRWQAGSLPLVLPGKPFGYYGKNMCISVFLSVVAMITLI